MIYDYYKKTKYFIVDSFKKMPKDEIVKKYKKYFKKKEESHSIKKEIVLTNVSKVYENGIKAIDNLSLQINPGEFVVLLGPSGCGKTTLLRMIAGLESISDGYIKFNDAIINGTPSKDRGIAMVFQNYALYPFMSVYDNIAFGLKNKTFVNNVYQEAVEKVRESKNKNYKLIKEKKLTLKLLKDTNPKLKDKKNRYSRLLKIAKLQKDSKLILEYKTKLQEIKDQIIADKNNNSKLKNIKAIEKELKELTKPQKLSPSQIQSRNNKTKKLIDEKYDIANTWKKNIPYKISEITKILGIDMYIKRKPADLSGGQRQRVALARAISKQSGLFLYDEPLSNLDAKLRAKMRTEIRSIHNMLGSTSIYVTHDQIEAMSMADKVVVMNKGYIQQVGTPRELLEKPLNLFVAKFIGNTDMNILKTNFDKKTKKFLCNKHPINTYLNKKQIDETKVPSNIVLGFRPEHVIIEPQIVNNFKENNFFGKITDFELLGNEALLTVKVKELGEVKIISNISYNHKIGEKVKFIINPNKIHIYDNKTGYNIFTKFDDINQNAKSVWLNSVDERKKNIYLMSKEKNRMKLTELIRMNILSLVSKSAKEKLKLRKQEIDYGDQYKAS